MFYQKQPAGILPPNPPLTHPVHQILDTNPTADAVASSSPVNVFDDSHTTWIANRIAFTIPDFLSAAECASLINHAEQIGFEKALLNVGYGRQILDETHRKSMRCIIDSVPLTAAIFARIKPYVPQTIKGHELVCVNERLRILKYNPGDKFEAHFDGAFRRLDGSEVSILTLQLYLNDVTEGGDTTFFNDSWDPIAAVKCSPGKAVVFSHNFLHEGSEIVSGVKYAVRTDIMYRTRPSRPNPVSK
ncbi:hypothetical protein HK100_006345 [Physocladia obscura]|uniref:Fe2OG dioxygenase domain-containing protein n=1 Tax=Physocladia obscura TaxID=109957 RepID=A0AAD5XBE1_9FUNG|nr:hypothetical protein HK100_006345 [Physocladia obscura]